MSVRLEDRIRALENRTVKPPTIVFFADGSTGELPDRVRLELLTAVVKHQVTPEQADQLKILRDQCIGFIEPGGAHLIELATVMWGPTPQEPNPELDRCDGT
jgi:hypothetical protein